MKDLAKLLTIAFCISSCGENPKINGTWITSSAYTVDGKSEFVDIESRKLLKTEGNTIRIKRFKQIMNEVPLSDTVVHFKLKNDQIVFEGLPVIGRDEDELLYTGDSIVLHFDDERVKHLVFQKLPFRKNKVNWTPTGNSYQFVGNKSIAFSEFLNDSIMIEYGQDHESVSINKWWFDEFDDYQFLVIEYPTATIPILVDFLSDENVHLKTFDDKIREYIYEPRLKKSNLDELVGKWYLTDKEYDTLVRQSPELTRNNLAFLKISKDSMELEMEEYGIKNKYKWISSVSKDLIFLIGDRYRVMRILDLNDNEMALEIGLERFEDKRRYIYRRE